MAFLDSSEQLRVLVVRADRIGDVVLATPVFEVIKRHYPQCRLTVLVREEVAPLLRGLSTVDEVMIFDPQGVHHGLRGLIRLWQEMRERRFRIAIVLQTRFRIAAAVALAGVRYRIGPLSRIHSFIFFNRGVRQHRSKVEMHETDYNLELLRRMGVRVGTRSVGARVHVADEARGAALSWLEAQGGRAGKKFIAIHPGMGGSALNWPESHYVELARKLTEAGHRVVITGGPGEVALLQRMREALADEPVLYWQGTAADGVGKLAGLFAIADLVVAPSTGPLHVAVGLGKPVVTFYPPIRVQSAVRWGPYGRDERAASVLVPENYCGEDFKCRGNLCNYYPCMKSLTVLQAYEECEKQLARAETRPAIPGAAPSGEIHR